MKITENVKIALKSILSLKLGEVATDKAKLIWDGNDELAEGVEVFTKDENDEIIAVADGDYITEDGKTITVANGKVEAIKEAEELPAVSEDEAKFNAHKVEMSATYDEIYRNIQEELNKIGVNGWIVEAAADYAIVNVWTENGERYFRYELTTNEDGTVILGGSKEVKPAFVPVEEEQPAAAPQALSADPIEEETDNEPTSDETVKDLKDKYDEVLKLLNEATNSIASLNGRIADLENKVSALEAPAADPIVETPVIEESEKKTKLSFLKRQ